MTPDWDAVFAALEAWRTHELAEGDEDPSVTAIAEERRRDPWAVLLSTIVSLRTRDEVTAAVSRRALSRAPDPEALLSIGEPELAELLKPAGFYRNKARSLRSIARILLDQNDGRVPDDRERLMDLPGVGLKTANLVLSEAFDQDVICVDIHVHRICNRLGWISTKTPDESEAALSGLLPLRYHKRINALLVLYGQRVCAPVSPRCSICYIRDACARIGVGRSR